MTPSIPSFKEIQAKAQQAGIDSLGFATDPEMRETAMKMHLQQVGNLKDFVRTDTIFMTLAGSHMYGTSTPQSDIDRRGVCVPPRNVVMGFAHRFEQQQFEQEDTIVYGLTKFMQLASTCNPNIIELLFAPADCVDIWHPTWERLFQHRHKFLSALAADTFTGYACGQLKKIESHRGWLLNPPKHKPTREEFGLAETSSGVRELARGINIEEISPEALSIIGQEKAYKAALTRWNQYEKWKQERNPARAALEADYGYDTKHASHLVRLLRMGHEILTTGNLTVRRPDAHELRAIRQGVWTYQALMDYVMPLLKQLDTIYAEQTYVVQARPDVEFLSNLCVELHEYHWSLQR
jgi:predicted nucleotidyltransferase